MCKSTADAADESANLYLPNPKIRLMNFFTAFSFFCGFTTGAYLRLPEPSVFCCFCWEEPCFFGATPLPRPLLPGRTLFSAPGRWLPLGCWLPFSS